MASKTYATLGEAINDPNSNIARFIAKNKPKQERNHQVIEALMASGLTREEAWHKALFG